MDPISFSLGLVAEVRHQVSSMKTRIANFQDGQSTFNSLNCKLDLLFKHMSEVDLLLRAVPNAAPTATSADFNQILADVCGSIRREDWIIPQSLSKPFKDSSSSAIGKSKLKVHQFTRAKALNAAMSSLEGNIEKASNKLLHLSSVLAIARESKEMQTKIDQHRAETQEYQDAILSMFDNGEMYTPATSTPALSNTIRLEFYAKDQNGKPTTPESILKYSVLSTTSSEIVTAAAGVIRPAYGVLGMAGVGKTVALQGIGHDKEILNRFCDGVHYMTFGRGATLQTAIREIAKIMAITGSSTQVRNVKGAKSLKEAVDYAVPWFEGRICLYILDDLWPVEQLPTGYLLDLRQLLRGSPESRMAISTRNFQIASEAGCIVNFEPRDALGLESFRIFMANSTRHASAQSTSKNIHNRSASVSKILSLCGGLPIALSVTGCAVAKYTRRYGSFEKACKVYSKKLEDKKIWLGDERTPEGTSLNAAILLSLEFLQIEFGKRQICEHSINELYTSLCILENQVWISVSVLQRLWRLGEDEAMDIVDLFCEMSLVARHFRRPSNDSNEELGILLHDLQLDFCRQRAIETKSSIFWHARLLNGYLETTHQTITKIADAQAPQVILSCTPRPWWSTAVQDDGYIHGNLSRHLTCSGHYVELAALLLDGRWTQLRTRIGGIVALEIDFDLLKNAFKHEPLLGDFMRSFEHILKAVRLSWGRMENGLRVFQFQLSGHLARFRKSSAVVETYLSSIENCTPKPFLLPLSPFFPDVGSSLIMEITVGGECSSVACSPCGRYMACGAGSGIVIAKSSNGEIIQRMQGHGKQITCLAFAEGSKEIVSGSLDGLVMLWEWELSQYSARVFEGHDELVTGVGGRIFSSSSDRTLRIWDSNTTTQTCELRQSSRVYCVAVRGDCGMIALGLDDGTLKVVDSVTKDVLFEDIEDLRRGVLCASFSPNSSFLAAGSMDIRVWNTRTWTRKGKSLNGHEGWVNCVSFSPDGKQIVSSSYDGTIRLWDVENGKCVGISPKISSVMTSACFTMDGQRIVSGSRDGIVRIWDARLGIESMKHILGHSGSVLGTGISQNGLLVASASWDRTVRLWDTRNGMQMGVLKGHTNAVYCASFRPDGRQLVSGSAD